MNLTHFITDRTPTNRQKRKDAKKTAIELIKIGAEVVGSFYRGIEMDYGSLCARLEEHRETISENCINHIPYVRHIQTNIEDVQKLGLGAEKNSFPKNIDSLVAGSMH